MKKYTYEFGASDVFAVAWLVIMAVIFIGVPIAAFRR